MLENKETAMRKGKWARSEDELLLQEVNRQFDFHNDFRFNGKRSSGSKRKREIKIDWVAVSSEVRTRTGKQCRERWINHLNPDIIKGHWTSSEDEKLIELAKKNPGKWATISRQLKGRSQNQVKIRWNTLVNAAEKEYKRRSNHISLQNNSADAFNPPYNHSAANTPYNFFLPNQAVIPLLSTTMPYPTLPFDNFPILTGEWLDVQYLNEFYKRINMRLQSPRPPLLQFATPVQNLAAHNQGEFGIRRNMN